MLFNVFILLFQYYIYPYFIDLVIIKNLDPKMVFIIFIMDIQVDFFRWQVPHLKEYLQHRGITCHLYRKHELVKLCELAGKTELDLEKITSTNDYELSQVNRRTITENGVTQVVCEIGQVPIWSSDLKLLPNIEQCDILFIKKSVIGMMI